MADLMNYAKTANGTVSVTVPRINVTGNAIDPKTGTVLLPINANFPGYLSTFTAQEQQDLIMEWIDMMVKRKIANL